MFILSIDCSKCSIVNVTDQIVFFADQIVLPSNYWRESDESFKVYSCKEGTSFCRGGNYTGDKSCQDGHRGLLCEECVDEYYYDDTYRRCLTCDTNTININAIIR